jgi:hypothetical protein
MSEPARVTDLRGRGLIVVSLLGAQVVWAAVSISVTLGELHIFERIRDGGQITLDEARSSDQRVGIVALVAVGLFVATGVAWLMWQHRAQRNLHRLGVAGLAFTPGWAVGWWFVPVANLFKPFQAMRELWRASRADVEDAFFAGARTWIVLAWWWGLLITSEVLGRIAVVVGRGALEATDYIVRDRILIADHLLSAAAAVLAIVVVRSIARRQAEKIRLGPVIPARPDMAGRRGV